MGLLAVIGPSRKENLVFEASFLCKYLLTKPLSYHQPRSLFSIAIKSTLGDTGLNTCVFYDLNLNKLMIANIIPEQAYI